MPVYYPSAQVTLALRVDELADTDALEQRLSTGFQGPLPPADAQASDEELRRLEEQIRVTVREPETPERQVYLRNLSNRRNEVLTQRLLGPEQRPEGILGGGADERYGRSGIQPVAVKVSRNGFRQADTATVELRWDDVPFDPRLVRSCGIEILVGVVSADDHAKGVNGERGARGQLLSIIDTAPAEQLDGSATRFVGWVDDWSIEYAEGGDKVTLECRDWTATLLDTKLAPGDGLNLLLPITQAISELLDRYPATRGTSVVWGDVGQNPNVDVPIIATSAPKVTKSRRGKRSTKKRNGGENVSLWDHITDACIAGGFVPIMRGYDLHIIEPRTRFGGDQAPRRMVYGRNLESLQFSRKLGGTKVPTIEVRCFDADIDRQRWARWPVLKGERDSGIIGVTDPVTTRANNVTPSGENPNEDVRVIVVKDVTDPALLQRTARNYYEQVGRQEIEGSFSTREVSSWDLRAGKPRDALIADLLTLNSGDAVELLVAPTDQRAPEVVRSSVAEVQAQDRARRVKYLTDRGFGRRVAEAFARLQEAAGLQTIFRVQDVSLSMDAEQGLSVECSFVNFVTIREEVGTEEAAEQAISDDLQARSGGRVPPGAGEANRRRRAAQKKRAKGEFTDEEMQETVQAERDAMSSLSGGYSSPDGSEVFSS